MKYITCLVSFVFSIVCHYNIEATRTLFEDHQKNGATVGNKSINLESGIANGDDNCYAVVRTNDPNSKYLGATGFVSVYNPMATSPQWSAARMKLQNNGESIEVGWMVNEDIFKDKKTHLYIRFSAGGKICFNLLCQGGFVQVAKDVQIGMTPNKISERGGKIVGWKLSIDKHKDDGNWWVSIDEDKYAIGYWPKTLFTNLADFANQVEWGGEVNYSEDAPTLPEMGNGYKPKYDTKSSAYYSHTKLIDANYQEIDPPKNTVKDYNCNLKYLVIDSGFQPAFTRVMLFGGPILEG